MPKNLFGIKAKKEEEKYIYLKNKSGLMSLVQIGVLEIHLWGSNITHLNKPDMIVFDLDPSPDVPWKEVVSAARLIKNYLSELQLNSYVKTTGGKGLHIVVPIFPRHTWKTIKDFTHHFVRTLVKSHPSKYISEMSKSKRKGKIFIDYLRNSKGATSIAAYSTRSRIHAPVSTPIHWDELTAHIEDTSFNIFSVIKRLKNLKNDPWSHFFDENQQLDLSILDDDTESYKSFKGKR
jgi:bifunctional non-homologous end joining protein LigD